MRKLLLIILASLFFGARDCRPIGKRKDISEDVSDDDETCPLGTSSWIDFSTGFMQSAIDNLLPSWGEKVSVEFLSFSRQNEQEPHYVTNVNFTSWNTDGCDFDPTIKTVFIIHGFKDGYAPWTRKLKDALILREVCNVFIVECGEPSDTYTDVLKNIPEVGKQVALFIRNLMKSTGVDLEKVHIIGHSAGGQSAGFAGKEIKKTEKRSVGRITGLDPAGPGFYDAGPDERLDASDASFVDIIHTNRGCNRLKGLGYSGAIGHFDFYPNGGQLQPGCLSTSQFLGKMDFGLAKITLKFVFGSPEQPEKQIVDHLLCSHIRSYEFFTASILTEGCEFNSVQCSGWNPYLSGQCNDNDKIAMGYYADRYKDFAEDGIHKKFYLNTTADSPYCI